MVLVSNNDNTDPDRVASDQTKPTAIIGDCIHCRNNKRKLSEEAENYRTCCCSIIIIITTIALLSAPKWKRCFINVRWWSVLTFFLQRWSKRRPIAVNVLTCRPAPDLVTVGVQHGEVLGLLAQLLRDGPALLLLHQAALYALTL